MQLASDKIAPKIPKTQLFLPENLEIVKPTINPTPIAKNSSWIPNKKG